MCQFNATFLVKTPRLIATWTH